MSFYTDNILHHPKSHTTQVVNDLDLLEPVTRQLVESIIADAKAHGIELLYLKPTEVRSDNKSFLIKKLRN